mmetsp:Transcript_21961/g.36780  ORF Transcript_21961/g.36780 Transcript_21961/m.36780 type:complete len:174 (+) Transcript_21961:124-645(+)|eukprot:CAMPEP_0174975182 /NCGR_PEP_ID=MMETSP0004_2-20121128/12292_1 /TAXON_ID=420556 /ORGANISM="Ochromonas sp., Strain CCMP1393" /LENGTH=173 /DNA_ID=CAMNT_0016225987 /DNA_START=72 /DNA_END=593 /DNA_ORIENTATION=-
MFPSLAPVDLRSSSPTSTQSSSSSPTVGSRHSISESSYNDELSSSPKHRKRSLNVLTSDQYDCNEADAVLKHVIGGRIRRKLDDARGFLQGSKMLSIDGNELFALFIDGMSLPEDYVSPIGASAFNVDVLNDFLGSSLSTGHAAGGNAEHSSDGGVSNTNTFWGTLVSLENEV